MCQSLAPPPPPGVSQGQEEGEGPLGHTRRFGQFWIVTISDPPQTGTWEILVTAESTPRVRVQGKEGDIAGKGRDGKAAELRERYQSHSSQEGL